VNWDHAIDSLNPRFLWGLSVLAAFGEFGLVALTVCMGFFWLRCDPSAKVWRATWFVILLIGFAYGSPIAYYLLIYLPAARKNLRTGSIDETDHLSDFENRDQKRIGPFNTTLLFAWSILSVPMVASFAFPKLLANTFGLVEVILFTLCSFAVGIESMVHCLYSVFRSGMRRPGGH
jgi:hypothetical protein